MRSKTSRLFLIKLIKFSLSFLINLFFFLHQLVPESKFDSSRFPKCSRVYFPNTTSASCIYTLSLLLHKTEKKKPNKSRLTQLQLPLGGSRHHPFWCPSVDFAGSQPVLNIFIPVIIFLGMFFHFFLKIKSVNMY